MVYVAAGQSEPWWFGVAWEGEKYVATAIGSTREKALQSVMRCVPRGVDIRIPNEPPEFFSDAVIMLGEIERGNEEHKQFTLSTKHRSDAMRAILIAAAAIPIGFVSTYGSIARAAGSEARAVGRAMSTNPLYPIVPCHRVVGADMSLVGYGGKQDADALEAKLSRLVREVRKVPREQDLELPDGVLTVYPVERVIECAQEHRDRLERKALLKAKREAADRLQFRLF